MLGFISQFMSPLSLALVHDFKLLCAKYTWRCYPFWTLLGEKPSVRHFVLTQICKNYMKTFHKFQLLSDSKRTAMQA